MNMAADDAVDAAAPCLGHHRLLVVADVLDGVLDLVLQVGRQRPVGKAQAAPRLVEPQVGRQRGVVGSVADECQPLGVLDDAVELVAVQHQEAPAVGGDMDRFRQHDDAAEAVPGEVAEAFVVIARDVDDARALASLAQQFLDDVVVRLMPVPGAAHPPDIDDVADEIEVIGLGRPQEIEEKLGIAALGAEVNVRYPDRAVTVASLGHCIHGCVRTSSME